MFTPSPTPHPAGPPPSNHALPTMDAAPRDDVSTLALDALALAPAERTAFLDQHCPDPALRQQVEALLQEYHDADALFERLDQGLHRQLDDLAEANPDGPLAGPQRLVGQMVKHYEIIAHLGGGGMGVVYEAQDTRLGRTVALKFLPPHLSADPSMKVRFLAEARAAAALDHDHICTIHEIGETDGGRLFIAMARYAGETLKKKIARGPLPLNEALDYTMQMAEGLATAHATEIIHRDIKPANVMVTDRDRIKILDFGLAKVANVSLTQTGTTLGTAAYMSPEQAQGESVDARTDIWSLGVVLYEMLAGERPFKGEYEPAVLYAILHEEPEPLIHLRPEVSEPLARIVEKMLQKDASERYEHITNVLADLRALRDTPSSGLQRTSSAQKTRLFRAGAVLFVVLVAAALYALWPRETALPDRKSIAVLPFENQSADSTDIYFSNGVTEDIIAQLFQIGALRVTPRATSMRYRGSNESLQQISEDLDVATLLTGNIRRQGNQVRISVELIDPAQDERLWGDTFDKELADIFAIQSEVAREIAGALQAELSLDEQERLARQPTQSLTAYDYYLKARDYYSRYTRDDNEQAIILFEKAIEADSNYAQAYAGLGDAYNQRAHRFGLGDHWLDSTFILVNKALAIDPSSAAAYKALGLMYEVKEQFRHALEAHRNALDNNPDYGGPNTGYVNLRLGVLDQAYFWLHRSWSSDPTFAMGSSDMGDLFTVLRDYEQAAQWYEQALELQPNFYEVEAILANLDLLRGQYQAGVDRAQRLLQVYPNDGAALWTVGFGNLLLGNTEQVRRALNRYSAMSDAAIAAPAHFAPSPTSVEALLGYLALQQEQDTEAQASFRRGLATAQQRLEKGSEDPWIFYDIAAIEATRGNQEEAYEALEKAIEGGWRITDRARIDPMLTSLHGATRFTDLLSRVDAMVAEAYAHIRAEATP